MGDNARTALGEDERWLRCAYRFDGGNNNRNSKNDIWDTRK